MVAMELTVKAQARQTRSHTHAAKVETMARRSQTKGNGCVFIVLLHGYQAGSTNARIVLPLDRRKGVCAEGFNGARHGCKELSESIR